MTSYSSALYTTSRANTGTGEVAAAAVRVASLAASMASFRKNGLVVAPWHVVRQCAEHVRERLHERFQFGIVNLRVDEDLHRLAALSWRRASGHEGEDEAV